MPAIVYYDFISAESFALNELVRQMSGAPPIEWRGVQSDPTLAMPMQALDRRAIGRLEIEIADALRVMPSLRFVQPKGRPNTKRALQAVASVERMHGVRAEQFRTLLFQEYWWGGSDLAEVSVLRRVAEAAGVPPWVELEHQAAQTTQVSWELHWQAERLGGVPRVIRMDGQILWGVRNEASTRAFLADSGA